MKFGLALGPRKTLTWAGDGPARSPSTAKAPQNNADVVAKRTYLDMGKLSDGWSVGRSCLPAHLLLCRGHSEGGWLGVALFQDLCRRSRGNGLIVQNFSRP